MARKGRPPSQTVPPTGFGRWVQAQGLTAQQLRDMLVAAAAELRIHPDWVPSIASIYDLRRNRYSPNPVVMLLVQQATGGEIGIQSWIPGDIYGAAA